MVNKPNNPGRSILDKVRKSTDLEYFESLQKRAGGKTAFASTNILITTLRINEVQPEQAETISQQFGFSMAELKHAFDTLLKKLSEEEGLMIDRSDIVQSVKPLKESVFEDLLQLNGVMRKGIKIPGLKRKGAIERVDDFIALMKRESSLWASVESDTEHTWAVELGKAYKAIKPELIKAVTSGELKGARSATKDVLNASKPTEKKEAKKPAESKDSSVEALEAFLVAQMQNIVGAFQSKSEDEYVEEWQELFGGLERREVVVRLNEVFGGSLGMALLIATPEDDFMQILRKQKLVTGTELHEYVPEMNELAEKFSTAFA